MREAGLAPQLVVDTAYSAEAGMRAMRTLLSDKARSADRRVRRQRHAGDRRDAGGARCRSRRFPDDIAIVGFDDIPTAKLLGLTTVRQPEFELGALAARTLMERLQPGGMTPAGKSLELKFEIVERSSA